MLLGIMELLRLISASPAKVESRRFEIGALVHVESRRGGTDVSGMQDSRRGPELDSRLPAPKEKLRERTKVWLGSPLVLHASQALSRASCSFPDLA